MDVEIVCLKDVDSSGSVEDVEVYIKVNLWFVLKKWLGYIYEIIEEWRFVGCELCFVKMGWREFDLVWISVINGRFVSLWSVFFGGLRVW